MQILAQSLSTPHFRDAFFWTLNGKNVYDLLCENYLSHVNAIPVHCVQLCSMCRLSVHLDRCSWSTRPTVLPPFCPPLHWVVWAALNSYWCVHSIFSWVLIHVLIFLENLSPPGYLMQLTSPRCPRFITHSGLYRFYLQLISCFSFYVLQLISSLCISSCCKSRNQRHFFFPSLPIPHTRAL